MSQYRVSHAKVCHKHLQTLKGDEYYAVQERLQQRLRELLTGPLDVIRTKQDLLALIAMSSTHRPFPPHIILGYISRWSDLYD